MTAPSMRSGRPALSAWRRIPGPPRDLVRARLLRLYRELLLRFGPQGWWPGRSPFEIAAGAILTQHTAWSQAARARSARRARACRRARSRAARGNPAGGNVPPQGETAARLRGMAARALRR